MNPSELIFFLISAGVVSLMMYAGLMKRALESKRSTRICPSCGRSTRDCRCGL